MQEWRRMLDTLNFVLAELQRFEAMFGLHDLNR